MFIFIDECWCEYMSVKEEIDREKIHEFMEDYASLTVKEIELRQKTIEMEKLKKNLKEKYERKEFNC